MNHDLSYLVDIFQSAKLVGDFVAGLEREGFKQDIKTQYAVIHCFEIIGEAAKHISEPFRQKYPDIPWNSMSGLRNRLIHDYGNVDADILWDIIEENIPTLLEQLKPLIPPEDETQTQE